MQRIATTDRLADPDVYARLARRLEEAPVPEEPCRGCRVVVPIDYGDKAECWRCKLEEFHAIVGFYREHQGATFADFSRELSEAGRELITRAEKTRGLFIGGPPGTGKTRLMAAIAAANGFATFGLARTLIRGTWDVETQDREIRRLATTPLLLLDDLGREGRPTESVLATIHEIISARNGNYLPTAITSNYTLDQLRERYDDGISDRLRPWRVVVMSGKSRR